MNYKKMEKKIIDSVNEEDVLSVENIKSRMDFSKKEFKNSEEYEVLYTKKKLLRTSLLSSLATFIVVLVFAIILIRINFKSTTTGDILNNEEIKYIKERSSWINSIPVLNANVVSFDQIYIIETNDKNDESKKVYYYKYISDDKIIYVSLKINDDIIIITEDDNFGVLCEGLKSQINIIEFTVKSEKGERYYCFTN